MRVMGVVEEVASLANKKLHNHHLTLVCDVKSGLDCRLMHG